MAKKNSKDIEDLLHCAEDAAGFLKSLASPNRLLVLCYLLDGAQCVSDLLEELPMSQPLLSQHLKVLKEEGVLSANRDGQKIYYEICDEGVRDILEVLAKKYQ